jgi:hypothetical protein
MVVVKEGTVVMEAIEVGTAHQGELCNAVADRGNTKEGPSSG